MCNLYNGNASLVKLMVGFLIAMTIVLSISVNANATPKHKTTAKRTEYAVTIDVSVKDNLTYVKTGDENVWTFEESDSDVGDVYKVTFDTRNTKRKSDDRIEKEVPMKRSFYFFYLYCLYKSCISSCMTFQVR